ncbi:UDP-N-acetylmuramoyl-L-alanine--D-glutamate ligase [Muricauda oceani]|uniref:UDP-N-acetylmuramoylalanine--D-glutamate ligase n=1 Tax=Flagellimonas oceani TaxID=2698672 RepID=A0A6G7IY43_9FLAO|nr:UDP-N-acetylmuramoyl-L-alanine--D-glutamate ligase [Allomuricauda oceani]MBW8244329.1 UDP-N-acetylmuramoyl-L-alanine--D-glutamate ligase [Allomuricauda oceani]QII43258.1 UDP-N-acetylmuramoyl-L-alanine--D-glutamate ligase [Allomuricauda oceani]
MGRLVILGGGESGVGTAILGKQKGFEVFVSDKGEIQEKYKKVLEHFEIEWESGEHTEAKILNADVVMKSPGIPDKVALVKALVEKGIPVISEIEFASKYTDATIIGITGSNGKTTTTMLTNHLLKDGGLHVGMAGNIGDSYAKMVAEQNFDHYVLEISSFQLDGIVDFKPHIAIITNITPDHLDRYDYKFENYIASKFRIAMNQDKNDYLIYDADDEVIRDWLEKHPVQSKLLPFSVKRKLEEGAWSENKTIKIKLEHKTLEMSEDILALEGQHNVKNTMAASMAAMLVKVRKETIRNSIQSFQGVPHRLEKVLKINHVEYINDSKATNVNATYYALDGIKKPIVWIVGGVDKGNDYSELMPLVREKVKAVVCLGVDNAKLLDAFGNVIDLMVETYSMEEAVKVAYKVAERGDAVLLSPACASFDLFKNYEDRGDQFKNAVKNL